MLLRAALVERGAQTLRVQPPLRWSPIGVSRLDEPADCLQTLSHSQIRFRGNKRGLLRTNLRRAEEVQGLRRRRFALLAVAFANRAQLADCPKEKNDIQREAVEGEQTLARIVQDSYLQDGPEQRHEGDRAVEQVLSRESHPVH